MFLVSRCEDLFGLEDRSWSFVEKGVKSYQHCRLVAGYNKLTVHIFNNKNVLRLSPFCPFQGWNSARRPSSVTPGPTAAETASPVNPLWDAETPPRRLQRPPVVVSWFGGVKFVSPPSTKSVQSRPTRSRTAAASQRSETAGQCGRKAINNPLNCFLKLTYINF